MNGLKNLLASVLGVLSLVTFADAGLIAWDAALPMAAANMGGAYIAARFVRQTKRTEPLRRGIVAVGLTMTVVFFIR